MKDELTERDEAILTALRQPYGKPTGKRCGTCRGKGRTRIYTADRPGGFRTTCPDCAGTGRRALEGENG